MFYDYKLTILKGIQTQPINNTLLTLPIQVLNKFQAGSYVFKQLQQIM